MFKVYSKNGLLLDTFDCGTRAMICFRMWAQAHVIMRGDDVQMRKMS